MNFFFRVDSSSLIGSGHVIRCLTLATELRKQKNKCKFICRDHENNFIKKIKKENFEVIILPNLKKLKLVKNTNNKKPIYSEWIGASWMEDAKQTINVLKNENVNWLVIDHYGIEHKWEKKLRPYTKKIMVIDDLANRNHDCDLLLDQNLIFNFKDRYLKRLPKNCISLLGPKYSLLQNEYKDLYISTPARVGPVKRILVYFGASDHKQITKKTLLAFLQLNRKDITMDIVISSNSSQLNDIKKILKKNKNIKVHINLKSLANLIAIADLAVGACGSTSWERCCLGLPSIVITTADNQKQVAKELQKQKLISWLGHHDTIKMSSIYNKLKNLIDQNIESWSMKCKLVTNGSGTKKVVQILNLNENIRLYSRSAKIDDEKLIYNLAADPLVRKNSFNSKPISETTHSKWFHNYLESPKTCKILIIETNHKLLIGQVRIDKKNNYWNIDYSLVNYARRNKIGFKLLKIALKRFNDEGIFNFLAKVKKNNKASCIIFEKLRFLKKVSKERKLYIFSAKKYKIDQ